MIKFIDSHKDRETDGRRWGVEPICKSLDWAVSSYYSARSRPPSLRAMRDAVMMPILMTLWVANRKVYGTVKLWKAAQRAGHDIGRDQVARLMAELGIRGVTRSRRVRTTRPDPEAGRPADLVDRDFTADRPNRLWVTDLTHVPTRAGTAYVCFIIDAFARQIIGWRVAAHMRTGMVLDALEMARSARGACLEGLIAHSDAGAQYTSLRWGERLVELGAQPSIGSVADSYDNALAESVNSLYKAELVYGPDQGPWNSVDDVELATLGWVHWWNNQRLHGYLGHLPPVEAEAAYHAQQTAPTGVGNQ